MKNGKDVLTNSAIKEDVLNSAYFVANSFSKSVGIYPDRLLKLIVDMAEANRISGAEIGRALQGIPKKKAQ